MNTNRSGRGRGELPRQRAGDHAIAIGDDQFVIGRRERDAIEEVEPADIFVAQRAEEFAQDEDVPIVRDVKIEAASAGAGFAQALEQVV